MNKTLLSLFLCCCFYSHAQTLDWVWARSGQTYTSGVAEGLSIATDKSNNVYVTGNYGYTITFGSFILTSTPGFAFYLAKYDAAGNVKWAKSVGNSSIGNSDGYNICTDGSGNVYLTGFFGSTVSFDSYTLTASGGYDIFLAKYDSSGNVLWAKGAGGTSFEYSYGVSTDRSGNVYIAGNFNSPSITFGSYTLTNTGSDNIFLSKYDSSGNVLWAKSASGSGSDFAYSVATDELANVYVTGTFGSPSFTVGSYTLTNAGTDNIFLAKYDSWGNVLWAKRAGGTFYDGGNYVATDSSGNAYLTGYYFSPSIIFGSYTLTNAGNYDAFLAKYDSSGNVRWATSIGGTGNQIGYCVTVDNSYKIYVTGSFASTSLAFDTITIQRPAIYQDPMYLAEYDSAGHALWAKALASGGDDQNAIAFSQSGCIYIGGDFEGVNPFILGNDSLVLSSMEDVFVAKLCYTGITANFISSDTVFCSETTKCINFFDHSYGNAITWQWTFTGATPGSSNLQNPDSICYSTPGTYPVSLVVGNGSTYDTLTIASMIIVGNPPLPPVITVGVGDTLYSSNGATYQWYLNGSPVSGATDSFIVAGLWGVYSVVTTDGFGCNAQSSGTTVSVDEIRNGVGVEIFPNPVSKTLGVKGLEFGVGARFEIFDVLGNEVYCPQLLTPNPKLQTAIDVSSLSNGIYLLKIHSDRLGAINKKFVVVHK